MTKQRGQNAGREPSGWLKKIRSLSVYSKIFAVIAVVFFLLGICSLGAFNGTGKSTTVPVSSETVGLTYHIHLEDGQSLSAVYINVGTVYADQGGSSGSTTAQVKINYYDGEDWLRQLGSSINIANIYSSSSLEAYQSNANYNWVAITTDQSLSTREYFRLNFTADHVAVQVNEVAFVDQDGKCITTTVASAYCVNISSDEVAKTLDAQNSFHLPGSHRYDFTYEEEYILESINGIELGGETSDDYVYIMSTDYNALGILIYAISTWIFGKSTFGLRLPSFLAAFGTFLLLYFLARKLFKSDKWGLLTASLFGIGGMFFSVGMTGTPMALALLAIVASIFFMYRFYAKGIDSEHPVRTALPVLFSVLCAGAAFCIQTVAVFPCILSLLLFAFGMGRLFKHREYRVAKVIRSMEAEEAPMEASAEGEQTGAVLSEEYDDEEDADEEEAAYERERDGETAEEKEIREIHADFNYKLRLSAGFFLCGVLGTILLLFLAMIPLTAAYMQYYGTSGFFTEIFAGIGQCFSIGDITPYTSGNAISPFSWFIALKGATIFSNINSSASTIVQVNVQANVAIAYASLVAFLFSTIYVIYRIIARETEDKQFKAIVRAYVGLLVGLLASFIPYLAMENASALQSYLFNAFYASFIVLAFFILEGIQKPQTTASSGGVKQKQGVRLGVWDIVLLALLAVFVVVFCMTMPMSFGWEVSQAAANVLYNWTSLLSNGRYGLIELG